jgi:hypothetical protein
MIKHRFSYRQSESDMEYNDEASMTQPDQSMTNAEYVKKFSMGVPIFSSKTPFDEGMVYEDSDESMPFDPMDDYLDPSERDAVSRDFSDYMSYKKSKKSSLPKASKSEDESSNSRSSVPVGNQSQAE